MAQGMALVIYVKNGEVVQVEDCSSSDCKVLELDKQYTVVDIDKENQLMEQEGEADY